MARKIEQIQNSIIQDIQSYPELAQASSTSTRALWRLLSFVQASAILLLEIIIDAFKVDVDSKIASAIPNTKEWLLRKMFEFQYSATNPQVLILDNLVPKYPVIDSSLRIVTRASVVTTLAGQVLVKLAKSEPPTALTALELSSAQAYLNTISVPGINYVCVSSLADRIYLDIDVYYNGQYSTVISDTINATINVFLKNLTFNGQLKLSDLEVAIRSITGVNDVLFKNIKVRSESTTFANGTFLVQNNTVISRLFPTIAGYVVLEDTVTNNINLISQ